MYMSKVLLSTFSLQINDIDEESRERKKINRETGIQTGVRNKPRVRTLSDESIQFLYV